MSIYVYISRRRDPLDEAGERIEADEWIRQISQEADFRVPEPSETQWLGEHARIFTAHSPAFAFDWRDGHIEVKGSDGPTIVRMKGLASALSAQVFSETGEIFDSTGGHLGFLEGFP